MSKEQLNAILQISAQNPPPPNAGPVQLREWFDASNAQTPVADGLQVQRISIGAMGADLLSTPGADPQKLIIYYHAGGFVFGSARSHRALCSYLSQASGAAVLSVDYRLAPEHPAPAAHNDAYAAYQWALDKGYAANCIALAGDSAGGNLALMTALRARDEGLALPAAIVAFSPALDFAAEGESHRMSDAPLLTRELMDLFNGAYFQGASLKSASITPLYSDLRGLPPVLLHVGGWELLRDDAITMAARLQEANVETELKVWDGMVHCWQLFAPMLDEATQSLNEAGSFVAQHLKPAPPSA